MRGLACFFLVANTWGQTTPEPTVRHAYVERGSADVVSLSDHLVVVVCKSEYDVWQNDLQKKNEPVPALSLYMNGILMKGPEATRPMPLMDNVMNKEQVQTACAKQASDAVAAADPIYVLQYYIDPQFVARPDTKEPWIQLLENPWQKMEVRVSVGPADGPPWRSKATIKFERIHWIWVLCWALLFVPVIVLFVKCARKSDIIRDPGELEPKPGVPAQKKAYSLARTQMALWTFLVVGMLVFIFMVTWNGALSNGILVLIGISFSTSLLAATAEGPPKPQASKGFLRDLLTDGDGPSFHRCQMVLFTIVLAIIFVLKAASSLVMPEFDPSLLALMGISSGTYLGFKLQGK
jgi:hypothetical protein